MSYSHIIGIDGASARQPEHDRVAIVGAAYVDGRLEEILTDSVAHDGDDGTDVMVRLVRQSGHLNQAELIMLTDITFAGFNVIDLRQLSERLSSPVLVCALRPPDREALKKSLLGYVKNGREKWARIAALGPMQPIAGLYAHLIGLSNSTAKQIIERTSTHGFMPDPLRTARLVASGLEDGLSVGAS